MKLKILAFICCSFLGTAMFAKGKEVDVNFSERQKAITELSALAGCGNVEKLEGAVERVLKAQILSENEIGELFLQVYAYAGFPRSLNAQSVLKDAVLMLEKNNIPYQKGSLPSFVPDDIPAGTKYNNGREVINQIFAGKASQKKPSANGYSETTDIFLKEHLFNDITSRNNLNFTDRELCTVSILAALENVNPQLAAHLSGAMNTGTTAEELQNGWLLEIARVCEKKTSKNAKAVLASVLDKK